MENQYVEMINDLTSAQRVFYDRLHALRLVQRHERAQAPRHSALEDKLLDEVRRGTIERERKGLLFRRDLYSLSPHGRQALETETRRLYEALAAVEGKAGSERENILKSLGYGERDLELGKALLIDGAFDTAGYGIFRRRAVPSKSRDRYAQPSRKQERDSMTDAYLYHSVIHDDSHDGNRTADFGNGGDFGGGGATSSWSDSSCGGGSSCGSSGCGGGGCGGD